MSYLFLLLYVLQYCDFLVINMLPYCRSGLRHVTVAQCFQNLLMLQTQDLAFILILNILQTEPVHLLPEIV